MRPRLACFLMALALVSNAALFYAPVMALPSCHAREALLDASGKPRCDCDGNIVTNKDGILICGGRCMAGAIYDAERQVCIQPEPPEETLKRLERKLDLLLERTKKE